MLEINVKEARSCFSKLLNKVEQGQDIILTRRGKRIACIVSPEKEGNLPSLKEFRRTLATPEKGLSATVITGRDEERY